MANAVCGYKAVDHLFLQKNVTTDLEQFLEAPSLREEDDVAVPYTPPILPPEDALDFDSGVDAESYTST